MTLPMQPKYSIGQSVFKGAAYWSERREQCPDCLGTAEWSVTTPAGETFSVRCHTCNEGWHSSGTIRVYGDNPSVQEMTIGSIRVDTNDDHVVSYMCQETGVGSGSIHHEETLFLTRDEAESYAKERAALATAERNAQEEKSRKRKKGEMVHKPHKKSA